MGTSQNVQVWAKQANTVSPQTDTDAPWPEGQDPATVNNYARSNMSAIAKWADDIGGGSTATGTANAHVLVTSQVLSAADLADGLRLTYYAPATNTAAAVTVAVDGLTQTTIKRADGTALAIGDIVADMVVDVVYEAGAGVFRAVNIAPTGLLASGTASGATLDIVLTGYTRFRGLKFVLSGFLPATDDAHLGVRFSTDGGSNYDSSGYNYAHSVVDNLGSTTGTGGDGSGTAIYLTAITSGGAGGGDGVGNGATEGWNGEIVLLNQASGAFWSRLTFQGYYINADATPNGVSITGGGAREAAQDTDAIRFSFPSGGNIAAGNYAVYGLV